MSVVQYDVVVIGAGVAGLTAGARLASRGYRVALVTTGEPTACLSTGCVDLCLLGDDPLKAITQLPADHPLGKVNPDTIVSSIREFQDIAAAAGITYAGSPQRNRRVLSALGTFKTTCLAPVTMDASPADKNEAIHIVTFARLRDFYPRYILSRFTHASQSIYDAGSNTTMGIASNFEKPEFLEAFITWLGQQDIRENKIGMPAVLGLENTTQIIYQIEAKLERPVFEIPTLPPSMPGRRLFNILKDHFRRQGGDILWSWPVIGVEKSGTQIEAVFTQTQGKPNSLNARTFILSTGSFVGGGLTALKDGIIENVLGLNVHLPSERARWFEDDYFSAHHPISKAGVVTDEHFRPLDAPWDNVFICGAILAHVEALKNGCGHGFAMATATAAADACAEYLR